MPPYDFDTPPDRRTSASTKWRRYAGRDIIPMWVADMDFAAPPPVLAALSRCLTHGVLGYADPPASLAEAVVTYLAQRHAWQIQAEWLVWVPGLVTGLNVACRSIGQPGDAVLTATPVYPPFLSAPVFSARRLIRIPLRQSNGKWCWDEDLLQAALDARTRLLLLCNPHNPVGRVFAAEELERLVAICHRQGIVICSDEIHCDLVLDQALRHTPTAALSPTARDLTITLMAPSKTFNLPGLGCSFAVIPDARLRDRFRQTMAGIVPHVNLMGLLAAEAAFREGWGWQTALCDYLQGNRDLVYQAIAAMPGLTVSPIEATYLAWIDTRQTGIEAPAAFFESAGVGLMDGALFDGPGHVRLNFGCARDLLEKALGRMAAALARRG